MTVSTALNEHVCTTETVSYTAANTDGSHHNPLIIRHRRSWCRAVVATRRVIRVVAAVSRNLREHRSLVNGSKVDQAGRVIRNTVVSDTVDSVAWRIPWNLVGIVKTPFHVQR